MPNEAKPNKTNTTKRGRTILLAGLVLLALVLVSAAVRGVVTEFAWASGSLQAAPLTRTGTAKNLDCSRNWLALGKNWTCAAGEVVWQGAVNVPSTVHKAKEPYKILAATDMTGQEVTINGHLPRDWQTATAGIKGSYSYVTEMILVAGHPVGSDAWWAFGAWAPLIIVLLLVTPVVVVFAVKQRPERKS